MRVEVQFDGGAWTDISSLVRDNYTLILRAASPDFHCATNLFTFDVNYDASLYTSLRNMTEKALVRYYDDSLDLKFSGYFLPSTSFTDNGMLTTQTCSIEAQDFTELLRVPVGAAEDDDVAYLNYKILDSTDPTHSITHALFTRLGLDTSLIASGVLISGVVGAFASSSYEDGTLDMLDTLMYEHGYVCNWDEDGYFRPLQWIIPEGTTPAFTFTDANIVDRIEEKVKPSEFEGNEVIWYGLDTKLNTRLYTEDLPWDDEGNFDGYAVLAGFYFPPEANVIDDTTGGVQSVYQEYNDTGIRYKTAGRYVSEEYVMDFALAHADFSEILITSNHVVSDRRDLGLNRDVELFFNKRARIRYHNPQVSARLLYYMHIDADVTYKKSQQKSKVQLVTDSNKLKSYESRFVFDKTVADALCKAQAQATIYGAREYSFTSLEDVAEGSYVALTLNSGVSATGLVVEKSYEGLTGIYTYQVAGFTAEYHAVTRRTVTLSAQPPLQQITQISNAPPAAAIQGVGDFHYRAGQGVPTATSAILSLFPAGGAVFSSYQWYYTNGSGIDVPISGAIADTFTVDYDASWFYADQVQVICRVDDKYSYTSYVTKTRDPDILRAEVTGALTNISYDNGFGNPAPSGVFQFTANFYLNEVPTVSGVAYAWQFGGSVTASGALDGRYAYASVDPTVSEGETYAQCTMTYSGVNTTYKRIISTSQYNAYLDWNLEWDDNKEAMYSGDIIIGNQVVAARVFAGTLEDDPSHPGYKRLLNGMALGSNLQVSTPAGTQMYSGLIAVNNGIVTLQVGTDGNATFNGTITSSGLNTSLAEISDSLRITDEGFSSSTSVSGVAVEGNLRTLIGADGLESQRYTNGAWRTRTALGHPTTVSGIGRAGQELAVAGLVRGASTGFVEDRFSEYIDEHYYSDVDLSTGGEVFPNYVFGANYDKCAYIGEDWVCYSNREGLYSGIFAQDITSTDAPYVVVSGVSSTNNFSHIRYVGNHTIVYTKGQYVAGAWQYSLHRYKFYETDEIISSITTLVPRTVADVGNNQIIYWYRNSLYIKSIFDTLAGELVCDFTTIGRTLVAADYVGNREIIYRANGVTGIFRKSIDDADPGNLILNQAAGDFCYLGARAMAYCEAGVSGTICMKSIDNDVEGFPIVDEVGTVPEYIGGNRLSYMAQRASVMYRVFSIIPEAVPSFQKSFPSNRLVRGAEAINGIVPATSGVGSLGSATKPFSDLHLKEGGTINFDNGDAVITQTGNVVNVTGAELQVAGSRVWTIGTTTMASSVDNYKENGRYYDPGSLTNSPFGSTIAAIDVLALSATYQVQTAYAVSGTEAGRQIKTRQCLAGTWSAWREIYTSGTDGNAGQPPAPKPRGYSATLANVGDWHVQDGGVGAVFTCVGSTGTAFWHLVTVDVDLGGAYCGIVNCGSAISGALGGGRGRVWFERIT